MSNLHLIHFLFSNRDDLSTTNTAYIVKSILAVRERPSVFPDLPEARLIKTIFPNQLSRLTRYKKLLKVFSKTFLYLPRQKISLLNLSDQFWKSL